MARKPSLFVDTEFVQERAAQLHVNRATLRQRAGTTIGDKTIQRALNRPGRRITLESGAALADLLGCGCLDVFKLPWSAADRLVSFGFGPPGLGHQDAARRPRVTWDSEGEIVRSLQSRQAVVVTGAPRSGKTDLARSVAAASAAWFTRGTIWFDGAGDPHAQKARLAECLQFFHPLPPEEVLRRRLERDFAPILWARRRLLVVDDVADLGFLREVLSGYRGPADLVVLTRSSTVAFELQRDLGVLVVQQNAVPEPQALELLMNERPDDPRLAPYRNGAAPQPALERLLAAIGGRLDGIQLASDLLARNPSASLDAIGALLEGDTGEGTPLLRHLSAAARRLFHRLGWFDGTPVPVAWAAPACGVSDGEMTRLAGELQGLVHIDHESRIRVLPAALSEATRGLGADDRADVEERFFDRVHEESRRLGALAFENGMAALASSADALAFWFRCARVTPQQELRVLEVTLALRHLLVTWRADEVKTLFERALATSVRAQRASDEAHLSMSLGRWLLGRRADFITAETLFAKAAHAFAELGDAAYAAEALHERGIALAATRRPRLALTAIRAAAEVSPSVGDASAASFECRLNSLAFSESRARIGKRKLDGWRRARKVLNQALTLDHGPSTAVSLVRQVTAHNRALVLHILGLPVAQREVKRSAGVLLRSKQPDDFVSAYVLANAIACKVVVAGRTMVEQRGQLERYWRGLLDCRGPAVGHAIYRLGQMAYYLNVAGVPPDGDSLYLQRGRHGDRREADPIGMATPRAPAAHVPHRADASDLRPRVRQGRQAVRLGARWSRPDKGHRGARCGGGPRCLGMTKR